jgi:bifunctional DNA-binding transcriptional regulator/antitoxin component of YhaV-PrlF toxin-antitoxin module
MKHEDKGMIGKCFGSTVVGPRGQLVIPVEARRELGIDVGTKLLVFNQFRGRGLTFVKVEAVEELLNVMSRRITEFAKLVKETETADSEKNEGD